MRQPRQTIASLADGPGGKLGMFLLVCLAGLALATVLAFAAPLGWPFELFTHFRAQYAVAAALLAMLLLFVRRPGAAIVAGVLAALHALPALQRTFADDPVAACGGPAFTVVTANLQYSNHDTSRFLDWLARNPADLVVLQEVTGSWAGALSHVSGYPQRKLLVREDAYGIGVMSRWPLRSMERRDFAGDGRPSLSGALLIDGRPVRFLALHTRWPILPQLAASRDRSLDAAAASLRAGDGPAAVLGDLNLTAYSPVYARFLASAGLRDASEEPRWSPTWAAGFWPLALRIDHVLVSPDLCVEHVEVGPSIGSDHRPVIARLRLASPAIR
jgi:endonuclease/exonuclease/phosphatase (EEP) superfamily protein YafD